MKAIAVIPGQANSVHLTEIDKPDVNTIPKGRADIPDKQGLILPGRGVLVQVLQCGVDGTDKEINDAEYGNAPGNDAFLVIGHENFGRVVKVGENVTEFKPGDLVAATVRRRGNSIYDQIGHYDMTTGDTYYEHGINLLHGFLTEYYVEDPEYLVRVPWELAHAGVLMEPMSIVEKGIVQTYEIQRRLRLWYPKKAAVLGAGAIGQLATLVLRLKGMDVTTMARTQAPNVKSGLIEELGARYISTSERSLDHITKEHGPFDIIFEATGSAQVAFKSMEMLEKNGVLILTSITGGDATVGIPGNKINLDFVLNNKVMFGTVNANREHFELGVKDFAHAETEYPGWLSKLLTHPVDGLENFRRMMNLLVDDNSAVKVFVNVTKHHARILKSDLLRRVSHIIWDIDGTITDETGKLDATVAAQILDLAKAGIHHTFITGRDAAWIQNHVINPMKNAPDFAGNRDRLRFYAEVGCVELTDEVDDQGNLIRIFDVDIENHPLKKNELNIRTALQDLVYDPAKLKPYTPSVSPASDEKVIYDANEKGWIVNVNQAPPRCDEYIWADSKEAFATFEKIRDVTGKIKDFDQTPYAQEIRRMISENGFEDFIDIEVIGTAINITPKLEGEKLGKAWAAGKALLALHNQLGIDDLDRIIRSTICAGDGAADFEFTIPRFVGLSQPTEQNIPMIFVGSEHDWVLDSELRDNVIICPADDEVNGARVVSEALDFLEDGEYFQSFEI